MLKFFLWVDVTWHLKAYPWAMFGKMEFKNPIVVVAPFRNEQNFTNFCQKIKKKLSCATWNI